MKGTRRKRSIPINHITLELTAMIIGLSAFTLQQKLTPWGTEKWGRFEIPAKKHNGAWIFKCSDVEAYMLREFDEQIDIDEILDRFWGMEQPLRHINTCLNTGLMRVPISTDS